MAYATIEDHISADKAMLENPEPSPQARRHTKQELHELEVFHDHHPEDHHDPNCIELFCEMNPDEPECLMYDD